MSRRKRARRRNEDDPSQLFFEFPSELNESVSQITIADAPANSMFRKDGAQQLADWSLAPKLLNISEASFLTAIPVKTLYRWNACGMLKGVATRIGKRLRFDRDALLRLFTHENQKATK